jgi:outer membrane protein assembly factor BamD (BamD/ComL family)
MKNLIFLSTLLLFITACGKQPVPVEPAPVPDKPAAVRLSPDKQQEMALEIFDEILNITQNTSKKRAFSEIEKRYSAIINNYPQARIARESYIRLMHLYITNKSSENVTKAEKLLQRFATAYPNDPMEEKIRNKLDEAEKK